MVPHGIDERENFIRVRVAEGFLNDACGLSLNEILAEIDKALNPTIFFQKWTQFFRFIKEEKPAEETEPAEEPAIEPAIEPAGEPAGEPAAEPAAEPAIEPAGEPAAEPTTEPAAEPATEPAAEPESDGEKNAEEFTVSIEKRDLFLFFGIMALTVWGISCLAERRRQKYKKDE
jgi:hypothetical protein